MTQYIYSKVKELTFYESKGKNDLDDTIYSSVKQRVFGGYDKEEKVTGAYDLETFKYWGSTRTTNFFAVVAVALTCSLLVQNLSSMIDTAAKAITSIKKTSTSLKKVKQDGEDLNKTMFGKSQAWKNEQDIDGDTDDLNRQMVVSKPNWKDQTELGLNQVAFDESTMPVPVCSCTGVLRPCYKWGNGGWQSSCCTTTLSMYPLPAVPNKRLVELVVGK